MNKLERLARLYCEEVGANPDDMVLIPCPDGIQGCCVAHYGPAWKTVIPALQDHLAWQKVFQRLDERDALHVGARQDE